MFWTFGSVPLISFSIHYISKGNIRPSKNERGIVSYYIVRERAIKNIKGCLLIHVLCLINNKVGLF